VRINGTACLPDGRGFSCSPFNLATAHHSATTGAKRTVVAQLLLAPSATHQSGKLPAANRSWAALTARNLAQRCSNHCTQVLSVRLCTRTRSFGAFCARSASTSAAMQEKSFCIEFSMSWHADSQRRTIAGTAFVSPEIAPAAEKSPCSLRDSRRIRQNRKVRSRGRQTCPRTTSRYRDCRAWPLRAGAREKPGLLRTRAPPFAVPMSI